MTSKQTKTIPEYNKIKWTWYLFRPHGLVEPNTYSSGLGLNYFVVTVIIIHKLKSFKNRERTLKYCLRS
jgi:hypothetical protein